jgi:phosphoserine phosphatase RsbU/P
MSDARSPLRVLIVEDAAADAELVAMRLEEAGYALTWTRTARADELRSELAKVPWDVVISDYGMPGFDAPAALEIVREMSPEMPFIIVSGSVGEELAVRAMKAGAHDFFLKDRLDRLASAVEREVREARLRAQRREAVEKLRASEERLKALFDQVIVGIAQTDADGRFTLVNQRFAEITGRSTDELLQMREHEIIHPDDVDWLESVFARARDGERGSTIEKRYVRPDGTHIWVNASVSVLSYADHHHRSLVMVVDDITDRRRSERERERLMADLERTVKVSEMFAGVLGHDLRNPLMTITMGATLLLRRSADAGAEETLGIVKRILRSSDRMRRMIDQLLDFTRMRISNGIPLSLQSSDLGEIAQQVIDEIAVGAEANEIHLELLGRGAGRWDRDRLLQLVSNLVANAVDHRDGKSSQVFVRVDGRADDWVRLEVENRGEIPPSVLPTIFEPLRTTKQVKRDRASGLGLGLYISRQIAHAHGGTITVDSSAERGTRFVVGLPRKEPTFSSTHRGSSFEVAAPARSIATDESQTADRDRTPALGSRPTGQHGD